MQLNDFFETISKPDQASSYMPFEDALLSQVTYGFNAKKEEDIALYNLAIIGIADGRNSHGNEGCEDACEAIRPLLASLRKTSRDFNIIDLGNIKGKTLDDRYFAVCEVATILLSYQVNFVILGGGQDYNLPLAAAFAQNGQEFSVSIIDPKLDLIVGDADFSSQTFLSQIQSKYSSNIFELNVLGLQKYYVGKSQEEWMVKSGWDMVRLRDLRNENISSIEPFMRDASFVSFDVGAIQQNHMPYFSNININGFNGFEACQMGWYAGMSDHLKCFCIQEYNPQMDLSGKGAGLCAQILWHLFESMSLRVRDIPSLESDNYKIFVVHLHEFGVDIRFYTNRVNNRWWIEVPFGGDVRMLACAEKDYLLAQKGELPEKWWKFFQKGSFE